MRTEDLQPGMMVKQFPGQDFQTIENLRPGPTRRSAVILFADGTKVTIGREADWIVADTDARDQTREDR